MSATPGSTSMAHLVANGWINPRYHLVIDKHLNDMRGWMEQWMARWDIPLEP